jgi:hypothetical protein
MLVGDAADTAAPRAPGGGCRARTQEPTRSSAARGDEDTARRRRTVLECGRIGASPTNQWDTRKRNHPTGSATRTIGHTRPGVQAGASVMTTRPE